MNVESPGELAGKGEHGVKSIHVSVLFFIERASEIQKMFLVIYIHGFVVWGLGVWVSKEKKMVIAQVYTFLKIIFFRCL